ncbi:MAG TPA: CPBP family intramembrane glutamic endopeptidase [Anaerolineales bacterium]
MNKLTGWIKHHQAAAFFIIVYAVAWTGMFVIYFIFPGNDVVLVLCMPFMLFSPALTAMLISGIAKPGPKHKDSRPRWLAFVISWLVSGLIMILHTRINLGLESVAASIVFGVMAVFPAWILSSAYARTPGIRKMFSTLLKPRGPAIWYLVIFLIFPGFILLSFYFTPLLGGESRFFLANLGMKGAGLFLFLEFTNGFLSTGGINEESGWRGFALPRFQARYSMIVAGLMVAYLWSFWHLPYDIGEGVPAAWIIQNRLFWTPLYGILMTWLYNRTNGSLLAPALFHPAMNTFGNSFLITPLGNILFIGLAIYAVVSDRMWKKLPPDHPAVYREPGMIDLEKTITEKKLEVSHV